MICSTYLEEIRSRLEDLINRASLLQKTLKENQLNWSPGAGLWSIGQIFEHMHLSDDPYLPMIEGAVESPKYGPRKQVKHSFFGKLIIKAAGPSGNAPAPKKMIPKDGPFDIGVIDRFIEEHRGLQELTRRAEDVDLSAVKVQNPIVPVMRMNLADAFEIATCHAERHIGQIEQIVRRADFPQ